VDGPPWASEPSPGIGRAGAPKQDRRSAIRGFWPLLFERADVVLARELDESFTAFVKATNPRLRHALVAAFRPRPGASVSR
jgi:hypothetical protein